MAKIRISKNDEQEYKRLVRNAKAKMRRLKKDHGIDLTDEISLPSLSSFQNRKEFNNFTEYINKFNKGLKNDYKIVKNEQGVAFTKKEVKNYERKQKEAIDLQALGPSTGLFFVRRFVSALMTEARHFAIGDGLLLSARRLLSR
jgi:hypothetical protein